MAPPHSVQLIGPITPVLIRRVIAIDRAPKMQITARRINATGSSPAATPNIAATAIATRIKTLTAVVMGKCEPATQPRVEWRVDPSEVGESRH